ncbi:hypothetical protein Adt_21264 [Abeliophyllum distichum]|uniref:Uncharacterized protein n=1 Tax=Abeliophyllum distichum TaxID=126358 RepID=A0ABD1SZ16_9LAMI
MQDSLTRANDKLVSHLAQMDSQDGEENIEIADLKKKKDEPTRFVEAKIKVREDKVDMLYFTLAHTHEEVVTHYMVSSEITIYMYMCGAESMKDSTNLINKWL